LLLEERKLEAAGPAPGRPLVHDHRVPSEGGNLTLVRVRTAVEHLRRLTVEAGERGWGAGECGLEVGLGRRAFRFLRAAGGKGCNYGCKPQRGQGRAESHSRKLPVRSMCGAGSDPVNSARTSRWTDALMFLYALGRSQVLRVA